MHLGLLYSNCILVYCAYIQPGNDERDFHQTLELISSIPSRSDLLLLGDFNAPDVNWNTLTASSTRSSALCECIFNKNLIQIFMGPMHHLGNTLDLILTNCPDRVSNIFVDQKLTSDHYRISFHVEAGNSHFHHQSKSRTVIDCFLEQIYMA